MSMLFTFSALAEGEGIQAKDFSDTLVPTVSMNSLMGLAEEEPPDGTGDGANEDAGNNGQDTDGTIDTQASDTTAADETGTESEEEKSGCGSTVAASSAVMLALLGAGVAVIKKKK